MDIELQDPEEMVYFFNPTREVFSKDYQGKTYTVNPLSQIRIKLHAADTLSVHLADKMVGHMPVITQYDKKEALKRIRLYD